MTLMPVPRRIREVPEAANAQAMYGSRVRL
jgi:hypothetical protein